MGFLVGEVVELADSTSIKVYLSLSGNQGDAGKIVILSRFVALSVSLTQKASLFQGGTGCLNAQWRHGDAW